MMRAEQTTESELRTRVEQLRRERDWARLAAQQAEERIRALVRERDALARANQELNRREGSQAQRLLGQEREAISAFATSIAHDFNNVLAVITSGLELLARTDQPERRARLIRRIEEAAWRGNELTRRLQAFSRALGEAARVEGAAAGDGGGVSVLLSPGAPDHLSVLVVEDRR
jgi:signal transduction histidine kinase